MYTATTGYAQYQTQAVETAAPAQLVLMLYNGALASITKAEQSLLGDRVDLELVNTELQRSQRIVEELLVSLDVERGGQIAANLASLYDFCLDRLMTANLVKSAAALPEARDVLTGLRDAWEEACCLRAVPTPVG